MKNADRREHYNLYYIFKAEQEAHPMMLEVAEEMRKNIF